VGLALWYFTTTPAKEQASPTGKGPAEPVLLQPSRTLGRHGGGVLAVAFSPNGKVLASAGQDRIIILWEVDSWQPRVMLTGHAGDVTGLAFSPDSARLASVTSASDTCCVRLWDVATAKAAGTLGLRCSGMFGVAWSPDGTGVACAGWGDVFRVLDVGTGKERLVIKNAAPQLIRGLAFSPRGDLLVTGGSGAARLWDAKTGRAIRADLPVGMTPSFLPTGDAVAGWTHGLGRVTICNVPSGKVRVTWWRAHPGLIHGLAVSPDGRFLASLGAEGVAKVWSTADQTEVATLIGHQGSVYAAAFAPDGARLATVGNDDGTVLLWDLPPICRVRK
jgi:WD40 repeat protein